MADDEYNRKLESLQQYIPFLNNMIVQLRDPRKKNREQQLAKMVSLHSMITDKKKKLKLETLIKCEDVILKLYDKVKSGSQQAQMPLPRPPVTLMATESPMSPITPCSPSPPRDIPLTKPVVIPTEKIANRCSGESQLAQSSSIYKTKIDIYSSAADSLKSKLFDPKPNIVLEQLGKKAPDMSKPPISLEDLEALQDDCNSVDTEKMTLNELTDLREKLQKQLSKSEDNNESSINTTVRNTTILTKKAVEKTVLTPEATKQKTPDSKSTVSKTTTPTLSASNSNNSKPVKVIKESASIFGSTLSSIDNKLLEGASNKLKEKERRSSTGHKKDGSESSSGSGSEKSKERRSSKDEKKSESSVHKSPKDKSSEKRSSSEHGHKSSKDKKEDEKKSSKDKKEKTKLDKSKDDDVKKHHDKTKKEHKDNKEKKKEEEKCKESPKTKDDKDKSEDKDKPKSEPAKPLETPPTPTYKRLADKYNPKPRKHTIDNTVEVPKNVTESIETSMKNAPTSIPFLDPSRSPQLPQPTLPRRAQTPLNVPLLSPTSSTNSMDNEVAIYNKKSIPGPHPQSLIPNTPQQLMPQQSHAGLLPTPQLQPQLGPHMPNNQAIPSHVSNILSNPNVTTIINNVVNQFKGGQGSMLMPQGNFMPNPQPNFGNNYPPNREFNNKGAMMPQTGGNYWGGGHNHPPQNHHVPPQNYSQRSFTPIPNQFENQQPIDYYPQGSTTPNPYGGGGHQPPPLMSPQFDNYEGRPPPQQRQERVLSDDGLFGNKDRDMRFPPAQEWRRPPNQWQPREGVRDPRLHRDPRAYREDPRGNYRPPQREPREYERDSRPKFRDPRMNRYQPNRYDRERTPSRSRSVSRESEETGNNTFASPLDSLYSGSEGYRKTGKGYGMQHFKIPKIKRDGDSMEAETKVESEAEAKTSSEAEAKTPEPQCETSVKPEASGATVAESSTETAEPSKEADESVASASVSSSTECDAKKSNENESGASKETAEVGEISSTNDLPTGESRDDTKINDQTEIINKFLKKLLENERTRAAASMFIDNVKNSLDDDKLKMVVETVKSAALEEEQVEKPKVVKKRKMKVVATKKKRVLKPKLNLRRRSRRAVKPIRDDDDDDEEDEEAEEEEEQEAEEEEEEEEEVKVDETKGKEKEAKNKEENKGVVVSVGERIKSRKRVVATSTPKKKKAKHRTELDLLHEDIQDMFIRDGVLTATGKRMCRLLKDEAETSTPKAPPQPEPQRARRTRATAEKFDTKANSEKVKVMSNVRVLIPKIPDDKLTEVDEDGQRYSLRRSNKPFKSYAEDDSEEEKGTKEKIKEEEKKQLADKVEKEEEDEEQTEEKVDEEKVASSSPKKMRKRSKAWASGVIPKRKKKEAANEEEKSQSEDTDKSFELIEPDKMYFSARSMHYKMVCKLCDFNGKNITMHYKMKHPESEVLSSRLSPTKAEEAIKQSKELSLDDEEEHSLASTRKYSFRCRFCDLNMNTKPSNFYDHVSTHTGEFRHVCTLCSFGACNLKPLNIHYMNVHGKNRNNKSTWIKSKVYGYICLECNFVQVNRKNVENHVNIYHLGEGKKVMKIYLSSVDHLIKAKPPLKAPSVEESTETSDNTEDNEELEKPEEEPVVVIKKKPQPRKKKISVEETESDKPDQNDEPVAKKQKVVEEQEQPSRDNQDEEMDTEKEKTLHVPVKKEKEIDMTVFTCNTNIQEENEKIEQERLKMMTELNESVKPNRQSLNFIEQLSNRLMQEEKEQKETAAPEMVLVKSEPMELEPELEETVFEPEPESVIIPELTPKKPSKMLEPPSSNAVVQVLQKDNIKIQGMIQKLKGILKEEKINMSDGPPPLTPLLEKPKEDVQTILNAGFLNIVKHSDGWEYACRVPSCLFLSKDRDRFISHWDEDHTRINQNYKHTKCKICNSEVSATTDKSLLLNFFGHVEEEHLGSRRSILRTRRLSGDKLSKTKEEKPDKEEEKEGEVAAPSPVKEMTMVEEKDKEDFDIKVDENPFPFKISGVMSLAESSAPVPPLSPIKEKTNPPKIESVVLKEAKLTATEKTVVWKCAEAMRKFLQCPRELYKCPQYFCKFATNWRNLFDSHIKAHAAVSDELVCCVYCEVKTPLSHAGLHIDLRHSNCIYSCSQCLYRGLRREYVMVHMKVKHKDSDLIISLPPKTAKTIMMSKQKRYSVKEACPPYRCGFKGCGSEFLYQTEFCFHLERSHQSIMICGFKHKQMQCSFKCCVKAETMVEHWMCHNCYNFHCLVCKFGCMEMYTMLEHYSLNHPNIEPTVVDRRTAPPNLYVGYSDEGVQKITYLSDELLESINVHQYKVVSPDSQLQQLQQEQKQQQQKQQQQQLPQQEQQQSSPQTDPKPAAAETQPKNVTILPLSLLQAGGANASDQKFIYILPKSVDGAVSTKLFTALTTKENVVVPEAQPTFVFASIPSSSSSIVGEEEKEKEVSEESRTEDANVGDPLSLDGSMALASGDESDSQDPTENVSAMKSFGLIGYQLYRCAFCDISFSNARDFKAHCMHSKQCRETSNRLKTFKCVHCRRYFKNPHGLLEHIQYHGQLRFCCALCTKKFPSPVPLKLHMRSKHNVANTITTPLIPNKNNAERDEFVLRPVPVIEPDLNNDSAGGSSGNPSHKTVYSPDEVDQLPQRYIFTSNLKCALCPYSTKVRTNLVRHLQFHSSEKSVPEIAPVNPVPCLDKNEKMFDKMTNLAISSFTGGRMGGGSKQESKEKEQVQLPAYVPSHRRYVCCAAGCNYLCLQEANLRHHLFALHVQEPSFTCAHCKANLKTDIEGFLKHLKLHDLHLYKCPHCPFVHNLRHKVDKHCTDKHSDQTQQRTITIRALETEPVESADQAQSGAVSTDGAATATATEAPPPSNIKWTKPWHCGMCKYRCAAKNDIVTHIYNKHDINTQYKCTLCSYKTNEKNTFEGHFKENHPDNDIDIIYVYYKSEGGGQSGGGGQKQQFDTTPLWQRDRPRVRHIRGILFEETSPQKEPKKKTVAVSKSTPSTSTSNLDLAIEAVAKGIDEATKRIEESLEAAEEPAAKETAVDESVIVIEDDEEEEMDAEENDLFIDVEGDCESTLKVKSEEAPEEQGLLTEQMLTDMYGRLGSPQGKTFKCPVCAKFRTKKISYFVYHLLVELKCHRFKCKSCEYTSVTFDTMGTHCQEEHNCLITANVIDTPIDKTVEYWMQMVIRYQSRVIVRNYPPPLGEEAASAWIKSQCEFCQRWFKSIHLVKEHELHHWAEQTYSCQHCASEEATLNDLFQHSFLVHPKQELAMKSSGPFVGKVIATLRHPPSPTGGQQSAASAATAAAAGSSASASSEEVVYACTLCSETERSVELLLKHNETAHPGNEDFRYKVLTKTKVDLMYCCTYCHERGSVESLKKHHQERHVGQKFSIYQYICLECSGTFLNIKDLRGHYGKAHPGKKVTYSCVENKASAGTKDVYCCTKCPFRSCSVGGIRSHVRKHLRPVDCLLCGATFIYPTEARAHHNKEHLHNSEAVEENKTRIKEYEDIVQQIIAAKEKGTGGGGGGGGVGGTSSRPSPPRRMLARKSTGAPFVREYSYYGAKKEQVDLKTINTSIE